MNRWEKEVLQSLLADEESVLKELKKQYKNALADINEKVKLFQSDIDVLDEALSSDGLDEGMKAALKSQRQSKIYQQQFQKALKSQVGGILDKMHGDNYSTISEYLNGCYEQGFVGTMYDMAKQGVPLIIPIDQAAAVKAVLTDSKVSKGLYNALGVNVGNLKKAITREISRGIASALPYRDIARNLSNVSKAPYSRTKTITRTEGHRIQQTSAADAQFAAKKKGADVVKQWDASLDARTRDSHAAIDGEIQEIDEKFSNGLRFPGDPNGPAAEVVNCRCTANTRARWALDEDELRTLKEHASFFGLDKTKNFKEFNEKYLKAVDKVEKSDIIKLEDFTIGRSLGAKAKNYDIKLPNNEIVHLTEGSRVTNVQVIAGKGRKREIDIVQTLLTKYPGTKEPEWQKVKGIGYVDFHGESYKAELHWYQEPSVGKVEWKVKPDFNGNWFIYEG